MARGTTLRNIRIPDELWSEALRVSKERGESVSAVVRDALQTYITTPPPE